MPRSERIIARVARGRGMEGFMEMRAGWLVCWGK